MQVAVAAEVFQVVLVVQVELQAVLATVALAQAAAVVVELQIVVLEAVAEVLL
jgi:hypothetical protein